MSKYNSFYEVLHGDESIPHTAHFIDNFSGDDPSDWWTLNQINGTNTWNTHDAIDGGAILNTGATSANRASVDFNDKRQFDPQNFKLISVWRMDSTASFTAGVGLEATQDGDLNGNLECVTIWANSGQSNFGILSANTTQTSVATTIPLATDYKGCWVLEGNTSDVTLSLNDVLEATKTTGIPTTKQQPFIYARTSTSASKTTRARYLEVYNK